MGCVICRSDTSTLLHRVRNIDIKRCDHCGFIAADVVPGSVDFDDLYTERYPPSAFLPQRPRKMRKAHEELRVAERLTAGRRLLDVGCSYGFFPDAARRRGWAATGVEVSASAAAFARTHYGLHVIDGTLEQAKLATGAYDVVSIRHVLEHVPDPLALLHEARRLLTPSGVLIVTVPNIDSLAYRLVGRDWWWIDPPTHLWYFSPRTLAALLALAHLVPVRMETSRSDDHTLLYTLLFALNQRTHAMQRVRGILSSKGRDTRPHAPTPHHGAGSAEVADEAPRDASPRTRRLWSAVRTAGEGMEALAAPAFRLADRAGLGSELLIFARAIQAETHSRSGLARGTGMEGAAR